MYRNLSTTALGISGRQSELIELALTYGFRGVDVDMMDLAKRYKLRGGDHAARFLLSAKIRIGGFDLPINWRGEEAEFHAELEKLSSMAEVASSLNAKLCHVMVLPASDELPYHENFELHRKRLAEIANVLAKRDIALAVGLMAAPAHRQDKRFEFIYQAEPLILLIKAVGHASVGLMYDSWNWHIGGGTAEHLQKLKSGQVMSVRLADIAEGADLATITDDQRLLPGSGGTVDNSGAMSFLAAQNYVGPVTIYPHPSKLSGKTRDAIVQACSACLDDAWSAAGLGDKTPEPVGAEA